jgi:HME family heavy-metal exporter
MLQAIIAFSIRRAPIVIALALLLLGLSLIRLPDHKVDVFPDLNAPQVIILTEAGGMNAVAVEQRISRPIEAACSALPGVRRVRSSSSLSLSLVYIEFDWGQDIYRARQVVSEALATARAELPPEAHVELAPIAGLIGEIQMLALLPADAKANPDPRTMRGFAEFELRRQLLAVPGVAQVVAIGGELPEYQVLPRLADMRRLGVNLDDLAAAAALAQSNAPAGYLPEVRSEELSITQHAQVRSPADIAASVIRWDKGLPIRVGDVADVQLGAAPSRGAAAIGSQAAVILAVKKSPGTNTLAVTANLEKALEQVKASLPAGTRLESGLFRQADFIKASLDNVRHVLRDAVILVVAILVLFLLDLRTTLITLTALPLSIAFTLLVMDFLGLSINVMTLGGIAIAVGALVDDAIIDVENIHRRLGENASLPEAERKHPWKVVFDASNEVRSSVFFATLIICLVFVPLLFLSGLEGRFFVPMGLTYIVATFASLVVAVTVVPALARLWMTRPGKGHGEGEKKTFLVRWLLALYGPSLDWALRWRKSVIGASLLAMVAAVLLARSFGANFLPAFNEGTLMVFAFAPPGTSLPESQRLVRGLGESLAQIEGVKTCVRRTGRSERDVHAHGIDTSEFILALKPGTDPRKIKHEIDKVLADAPGLRTNIGAPIGHQLSEILSGARADIAVNFYGEDLTALRAAVSEAETAIKAVPGSRDVLGERELLLRSIRIDYQADAIASRLGIPRGHVAEQVQAAFAGRNLAEVTEGPRTYQMTLRLPEVERRDIEALRSLPLHGAEVEPGRRLEARLDEVAEVQLDAVPMAIQRQGGRRKAVVSVNVADGANLEHLVAAVRQVVEPIAAKHKLSVELGGQFEAQQSARRTLLVLGAITTLGVLLLLATALDSLPVALIVMVNLPLALIGGVLAVFCVQGQGLWGNLTGLLGQAVYEAPILSISSMVGFVTLFGIAVRNGILLANHYATLNSEGRPFEEVVRRGSAERLVPILMTAITAILGLIPLALRLGQPGAELLAPLAVVVIGGLISSTLLNCYVVPAAYHLLYSRRPQNAPARKNGKDPLALEQKA